VLFLVAAFVAMMAQAVSFSYLGLYLDTLGANEGLIGFATALGSAGQTVLMLGFLPWLLRRWGSQRLLALSLFAYGLRFAVWALVPHPWVVTASQLLLGLTFGATLVASVDFADRHAPQGMRATSQALITSLVSGLGRSGGGMLAGMFYSDYGAQTAFGVFGGMSVLAGVAYALFWKRAAPDEPS
jgi:PPP family 3-phenylpropionic acid transporter